MFGFDKKDIKLNNINNISFYRLFTVNYTPHNVEIVPRCFHTVIHTLWNDLPRIYEYVPQKQLAQSYEGEHLKVEFALDCCNYDEQYVYDVRHISTIAFEMRMSISISNGGLQYTQYNVMHGWAPFQRDVYVCKYKYAGPSLRDILQLRATTVDDIWDMNDLVALRIYIQENITNACDKILECFEDMRIFNYLHGNVCFECVHLHPKTFDFSLVGFSRSVHASEKFQVDSNPDWMNEMNRIDCLLHYLYTYAFD
jgi:hypothetical protein